MPTYREEIPHAHVHELDDILDSMSELIEVIGIQQPEAAVKLEALYNQLSDIQEDLADLALVALLKSKMAGSPSEVSETSDFTTPN